MPKPLHSFIDLRDVRENKSVSLELQATPEEGANLAKRLKILEVIDLKAFLAIKQGMRPDLFTLEGRVTAHVVQACSVTLTPVPETIDEAFNETMTTSREALNAEHEDDYAGDEPVELIENDRIDLGEVLSQWVGLALDPYPRSDAPPFQHIEAESGSAVHNSFEVLKSLKNRK